MRRQHNNIPWFVKRGKYRRFKRKFELITTRWGMIQWSLSILIICIVYAVICCLFGIPESIGVFGDQFGALNAWFTGIAFAVMIITLRLQRKELQLTREAVLNSRDEMENTRKAFEKQTAVYEKQTAVYEKQQFFNMLTGLLGQYYELRNNLSYTHNSIHFEGSQVFRHIATNDRNLLDSEFYKQIVKEAREAHVEGCCSILLLILKTVEVSCLNEQEKILQREVVKNILTKEEKLIYKKFYIDYKSPLFKEFKKNKSWDDCARNIFMVN